MKTSKIKKIIGSQISRTAITVAKIEANTACPYLSYQPKKPEDVKKMRKF